MSRRSLLASGGISWLIVVVILIVNVIGVGVVCYVKISRRSPIATSVSVFPAPVPTPVEYDPTEARLNALYAEYNEDYFGGKLPVLVKVRYAGPDRMGTAYGQYRSDERVIEINTMYSGQTKQIQRTLLHEMVHVRVERERHQRALKRLKPTSAIPVEIIGGGGGIGGPSMVWTGTGWGLAGGSPYQDPHDEYWQQEMLRLANAGAFKELW